MQERLNQIVRCMQELELCRENHKAGYPRDVQPLILLGELDWLEALHYLIHEAETS